MNTFTALLDQERRAVALLKAKLGEREKRLAFLESMANADKFDIALEEELTKTAAISCTNAVQSKVVQPGQLDERYQSIVDFIGASTKTSEDVKNFLIETKQISADDEAKVRRFMFELRKKFHVLESPRRGVFRATSTTTAERSIDQIAQPNEKSPQL